MAYPLNECAPFFREKVVAYGSLSFPCILNHYSLGKREIKALHVKCDSVAKGCEWEGTVGTLEEHVNTCGFTSVPCPKECKQNNTIRMILKKDLEKHLTEQCVNRAYECQYCGKKDTYANITDIHDDLCEKKPHSCPNPGCPDSMQHAEIKQHLDNDCEHTVISCKYERIGCDVKMKRKDMGAHEQDDKAHLHQALNTVVKLQQSATETNKAVQQIIASIKEENKAMQDRLQSATETITSMQKIFVIFKVINFEKKKGNNQVVRSQSFYTGIDEYNMRIKVYLNGIRDGKGTHVSVFIYILKGDNDDNLDWPFIGTAKIELLNLLEDKNHHFMTVPFKEEYNARVGYARGYLRFIPHSQLSGNPVNNTQYLKDDTLYFRVSVEVSGHKPWLECTLK